MIPFRLTALILLAILCGCTSCGETASGVLSQASETEFGDSLGCSETVAVAENVGINYETVVEGCLARNRQSMHVLFWLTKHAGFDAASSQGHSAVLGVLLRKLGDTFYGSCLASEPDSVQNEVREHLLYDLGFGNTEISLLQIKKQFPQTFP